MVRGWQPKDQVRPRLRRPRALWRRRGRTQAGQGQRSAEPWPLPRWLHLTPGGVVSHKMPQGLSRLWARGQSHRAAPLLSALGQCSRPWKPQAWGLAAAPSGPLASNASSSHTPKALLGHGARHAGGLQHVLLGEMRTQNEGGPPVSGCPLRCLRRTCIFPSGPRGLTP